MDNEVSAAAIDVESVAGELREAETTRSGIAPLTDRFPGLSVDEAYRIQRAGLEHRIAAGEVLVGRKIGLTSLAIQRQLGVDEPDYGAITDAMVVENHGELDPGSLLKPRLEAEFAFEIGENLPTNPTFEQVAAAVTGVAVAIEVIDSRVADWRIKLADTVADNASMARVVWGEFVPATPELLAELPDTVIALLSDETEASAGPGSAVLGNPLTSLHWLAQALGAQGDSFAAGDRVLAGAVAAAVDFTPGHRWTAHAAGLPAAVIHSTQTSDSQV